MNSKKVHNKKLFLSIMLIISMVLSMIPAYAMTGQVVMNEAHVTSWDDLVAQFGGAEANKVVIPEDTTVYVDSNLDCESGSFTVTGGGTLKRGDSYKGYLFNIKRDAVVIMDNIIIDGKSNGLTGKTNSAVSVNDNAKLSLTNGTVIKNNDANNFGGGGAIINYYGTLDIGADCKIEGNSTTGRGSAIYMVHGTTGGILTIDGAEISNNTGDYAIYCTTSTNDIGYNSYSITNTKITNNTGGGINLVGRDTYDITLQGCEISGNTAPMGAGLNTGLATQDSVKIQDCTFENNIATLSEGGGGGAIHTGGNLKLENTNIINNESKSKGGAIYGANMTNITIEGGLIEGNKDVEDVNVSLYGKLDVSEGATINGSINAKDINVQGLVSLEGKVHRAGKYTITAPLDAKSIIEVGITDYSGSHLISGTDGSITQANTIYRVAVPAAGYTISEQDFNCFKINGKSGHPAIDEKYLGLYMGEELASLDNWAAYINSGEIAAYRDSIIDWDENSDNKTPQTTTIKTGEEITIPYEPEDKADGKEFTGWFTEKVDGDQIANGMIYTKKGDSTYYAQWKEPTIKGYSIYGNIQNQGKPLIGANIVLYTGTGGQVETKVTDIQGNYEFENVPNGKYMVLLDFGEGMAKQAIVADDDVQVNFEIGTGAVEVFSIYGFVRNKETPLPNVTIELYEISTTAVDGKQLLETTTTDAQGRYEFDGLSNGRYIVKCYYDNNRESEVLVYNGDKQYDFDYISIIIKAFKVYGNISNYGSPLSGVNVELHTQTSTIPVETTMTDTQGYYEFKNKSNGQYVVKVNFGAGKEAVAIIADADKMLNFEMNTGGIATFKISGNVKDDKGQALGDVAVNLLDANNSGKLMNTVTDTSGSYKFENLLNGSYIVEAIGADGKATKTAAITNSNIEVYLEIASKEPVDPGEGDGDNTTGGGDTGGGDTGGGNGGGNTGGGGGGGDNGGGNTTPPTEPEKPKPTPPTETEKPKPTPPTEEKPKPTPPTEEKPKTIPPTEIEKTKPIPVLPVAPEQPVPSEPIPFPTEEPSEIPAYEEEITEPVIETPDIEEPTVPEENISEEVVDNKVSGDETTGASNSFMETFKKILLVAAISLLGLLTLGLLWLMLLAWYRRVKIFNNINTDEYKEDEWSLIHKTYVKKEDKGIYYIQLPEEIVSEFVTNSNQIVLKEAFVQRHHGDIMMIRIDGTDRAYSARIDNSSNIVKFNYDDFKVEEQ